MEDREKIEDDEYKKRVKELIERVEKGDNSPEMYRQLLEKIDEVKRKAISIIDEEFRNIKAKSRKIRFISIKDKESRNIKAIFGFVFALREYYSIKSDPNFPFSKDGLQEEIDVLYKLIYDELKKPNLSIPERWSILERRRILKDMEVFLGTENMEYFSKNYKLKKLIRFKFEHTKYYKYYACCWTIAFIVLLTIFFAQRL